MVDGGWSLRLTVDGSYSLTNTKYVSLPLKIFEHMKLWQEDTAINKRIENFTVGKDRELDLWLAPYDILG